MLCQTRRGPRRRRPASGERGWRAKPRPRIDRELLDGLEQSVGVRVGHAACVVVLAAIAFYPTTIKYAATVANADPRPRVPETCCSAHPVLADDSLRPYDDQRERSRRIISHNKSRISRQPQRCHIWRLRATIERKSSNSRLFGSTRVTRLSLSSVPNHPRRQL